MLNLWVCDDPEEQGNNQHSNAEYFPETQGGRWEPYPTNLPKQSAGSIYGTESTNTDARLLQVPVVSTGGSVLDTRSRDYDRGSAAGSKDLPSMRNFYKRAQQQQMQQQQLQQQQQHQQAYLTAPATHNIIGQNFNYHHHHHQQQQQQYNKDGASSIYNQCQQYQPVTNSGNYYNTYDCNSSQYALTQPTPSTCSHYSYNDHQAAYGHVRYNGSTYDYNQHDAQAQNQSHYGSYANVDTQWSEPTSQYGTGYDLGLSSSEPAVEEQQAVTTSPSKEDSIADSTQFLDMYHSLCLFSKTYGHTNVPKVTSWFLLGSWVEKLRKRKKFQMLKERGITVASASNQLPPLSDHELGLLEDIGFDWNAPSEEENDKILADMKEVDNSIVQQASTRTRKADASPEVVESSGSHEKDSELCPVDGAFSMEDSGAALSSDATTTKTSSISFSPLKCKRAADTGTGTGTKSPKKSRKNKAKKTTAARGRSQVFVEENEPESDTMVEQMWNAQYKKLAEFKKAHGNCAVPARNPEDPKLGHWVMTQRRQYHLLQKGKPSRMTKDRIEMLEQLDFQWSIRTNPTEMWNKRLQELVEYREKHGDCLVPQRFNENPQLGTWVNTQRRHYKLLTEGKRSCMTTERLDKLNEVGFSWSTSSGDVKVMRQRTEDTLGD